MSEQGDSASWPPAAANAMVKVTADRLEAEITLQKPQNNVADLTLQQLRDMLSEKGIIAGVLEEQLKSLAKKPVYDLPVVVAKGISPQHGKDGALVYTFNTHRDIRPKERSDGSVNFRELGLIESVVTGDLLCTKHPPTQGIPGSDIYGNSLPAKAGKDCFIYAGKNTVLSEDKTTLHAAVDGQVKMIDNKVCVYDVYTIKGDVSPATGDIHFSGNIIITGGVLAGFSVHAAGDIDVGGVVESAHITAGGALMIRGGFSGGETGVLNVGSDITCRFIQGGKVTLQGNLETTYILSSDISCGGAIHLTGKGLIVGGHVAAFSSITANTIGSASATPTIIEVGNTPGLLKRIHEIPKEIEDCEKNIRTATTIAKTLLQLKNAGRFTPDHAEQLKKNLSYINRMNVLKNDLELELDAANLQIAVASKGKVCVYKTAYAGVKLILGNEHFPLKNQYEFTCFSRNSSGGGISCLPL